MVKDLRQFYTMYDGEELNAFCDFLERNKVKYDIKGTGGTDFNGDAENDVVIYPENQEEAEKVEKFLFNLYLTI